MLGLENCICVCWSSPTCQVALVLVSWILVLYKFEIKLFIYLPHKVITLLHDIFFLMQSLRLLPTLFVYGCFSH